MKIHYYSTEEKVLQAEDKVKKRAGFIDHTDRNSVPSFKKNLSRQKTMEAEVTAKAKKKSIIAYFAESHW